MSSTTRARLVTIALILVVCAAFAPVVRNSVQWNAPPQGFPPSALVPPLTGGIIIWQRGSAAVGGWAQSQLSIDCPAAGAWMGPSSHPGFLWFGPVASHQRILWSGFVLDLQGHRVLMTDEPEPAFRCYWPRTSPISSW